MVWCWKKFILLSFLIFSEVSSANFVGNDTSNFNPAADGLDFVTVQSSQTLLPGLFNAGFFLNQAGNMLPPTMGSNGQWLSSQNQITFGDWNFGYGLVDHWELNLNFSYLLNQQVNMVSSGSQFDSLGLNEIRIGTKYNFLPRSPMGASVVASVNINEEFNNPFVGQSPGPTLNLEGVMDGNVGEYLMAVNVGYRFRNPGPAIPGALYQELPNQYIGSFAASRYFPALDLKAIAELILAKAATSVSYVDGNSVPSEVSFGLKYDATANMSLHFGGGTRIGQGLFTPDWRVYAGLNLSFDVLHRSASTVLQTGVPTDLVAANESPAADSSLHLHIKKGYQHDDINALIPVPFDEIMRTHEFALRNTVSESLFEGDKPPFEIIRLDDFDFDFGSAHIRPQYHPLLDRLAVYLSSQPEVVKIRVEGHTDSLGSVHRNQVLSQARAEALKAELVKRGVLKNLEIEAVGYGPTRPIADNGNFQGRKLNRRVELRTLRQIVDQPETIQVVPHAPANPPKSPAP